MLISIPIAHSGYVRHACSNTHVGGSYIMKPEISQEELARCYQPLFDLMSNEHDKILTVSEMDEIISASLKVYNRIDNLMQEVLTIK